MYQVIIVVHVLLGLGVIGFVLIQQGKGADAGAAFGSASSGSVFGAQGASSFLSRTTAILAALFFSTSLGLAILSGNLEGEIDLMDQPEVEEIVVDDVPLINGVDSVPDLDGIPVINEDLPATEIIPEDVSSVVEAAVEEIKAIVDTTESSTQDLVEGINTDIGKQQ